MIENVQKAKSALVLVAGLLAELLNQGLIPAPVDGYVSNGLAILTTLGVIAVNAAPVLERAAANVLDQKGQHAA